MWWTKQTSNGPIGLIAGQGEFPLLFVKAAASLNKEVIIFGVEGITDKRVGDFAKAAHYVEWGALGPFVDLIKRSKVKNVAFAGGLPKKEIYKPDSKLDETAKGFIHKPQNKGDDHLLRAFELFLKAKCGVSVMDARLFLKDILAPKGVMTRRAPTEAEWKDLKFGYRIAKGIGKLDIGQTVMVKNGIVLAVEAIEGTDSAIKRGGELAHRGAVMVKVSKPNQDLRFDLPCVGLETLESLRSAASSVLGVEAGKTLVLFKEKVIETANQENITVVGL